MPQQQKKVDLYKRSEGWHQVAFRIGAGEPNYSETEIKDLLSRNQHQLYEFAEFQTFKRRCKIYFRQKKI